MKTVKSSAVIVSAILLVCVILCTGCPNASGGANPSAGSVSSSGGSSGGTGSGGGSGGSGSGGGGGSSTQPETITIIVRGDANVTVLPSATFTVDKGAKWNDIRAKAEEKVSYRDGYGAAGWKFEDGTYITGKTIFSENKTVFAVSSQKPEGKIRLVIRGDERIDEKTAPKFIDVGKGITWAQIRGDVVPRVPLETTEWPADEYGVYEWRVTDENGELITDTTVFGADTTVYAVTNYTKFKIAGSIVKGYTGAQPKGKIIIPDGIIEITEAAFYECAELTQVRFPKSLKKIKGVLRDWGAQGAFWECTKLQKLDFSSCTQLTEIGDFVFSDCTGLTGMVSFPKNLTTIGMYAFSGCKNVGNFDFSSCTQLTKIGRIAFSGCTQITQVKLPASLETISENAFDGCKSLTSLTVDSENPYLCATDNIVFTKDKTKLLYSSPTVPSANIPEGVTEIAASAFMGSNVLKSLTLPSSLKKIGRYAFHGCNKVEGTVHFPKELTTIGDYAFMWCEKVREFDFSLCTQLTEIGTGAFHLCPTVRFKVKKAAG